MYEIAASPTALGYRSVPRHGLEGPGDLPWGMWHPQGHCGAGTSLPRAACAVGGPSRPSRPVPSRPVRPIPSRPVPCSRVLTPEGRAESSLARGGHPAGVPGSAELVKGTIADSGSTISSRSIPQPFGCPHPHWKALVTLRPAHIPPHADTARGSNPAQRPTCPGGYCSSPWNRPPHRGDT